jgi:hypothetical protein
VHKAYEVYLKGGHREHFFSEGIFTVFVGAHGLKGAPRGSPGGGSPGALFSAIFRISLGAYSPEGALGGHRERGSPGALFSGCTFRSL